MSRVSGRKEEKRREEWASSGSGSAALVPWKTLVQSEALQLDYTTVYSSRAPQCFLPVSTTTDWMRYTSGAALCIHPGHNLWTSNTESGALKAVLNGDASATKGFRNTLRACYVIDMFRPCFGNPLFTVSTPGFETL